MRIAENALRKRFLSFYGTSPNVSTLDLEDFLFVQTRLAIDQANEGGQTSEISSVFPSEELPNLGTVSRASWPDVQLMTSEQYFSLADALRKRIEAGETEEDAIIALFTTLDEELIRFLGSVGVKNGADFLDFLEAQQPFSEYLFNQ